MELKQGTIATAAIVSPDGKRKVRPVVIASTNEVLKSLAPVLVIGISASYRPEDPDIIPVPWHPEGRVCTGLRKPSAISIRLRAMVSHETLTPTSGWVGKAALIELLEKLAKLGSP